MLLLYFPLRAHFTSIVESDKRKTQNSRKSIDEIIVNNDCDIYTIILILDKANLFN